MHVAIAMEEVQVFLQARDIHLAVGIASRRDELAIKRLIAQGDVVGEDVDDRLAAGIVELTVYDRVVVSAHAAQKGAHVARRDVATLVDERAGIKDHRELVIGIDHVVADEAHAGAARDRLGR